MTQIATLVFLAAIALFFVFDRDPKAQTSKALWIPVIWLSIAASRNVGEWVSLLQSGFSGYAGEGDSYLEGNPIDRNALGTLIGLGIIVLIQRRREVQILIRKNWPLFLYFFYCGVSVIWSDYPSVGFRRWNRAIGDIVIVMIVLTERDVEMALKRLLTGAGFVLIPLSLLFIRYYPELGRSYGMDGTPYWGGVTGGKNSLGMICLLFGLAFAWRFLAAYRSRRGADRTKRLIVHGVLLLMALSLLKMVNSATSLACLVLAGTVMFMATRVSIARRPALVHLIVVSVITLAVVALFFDPTGGMVGTLGRNATLTGRTDIWKRAISIVQNPILGAGFETFWLGDRLAYMKMLDIGLNHAHDGYIEVYLNLGLVGVGLIVAMMLRGYTHIVASLRQDPYTNGLKLAYFVVGVIYNCTESGFKMMAPVWIGILLSTTIPPRRARIKESQSTAAAPSKESWWREETEAAEMSRIGNPAAAAWFSETVRDRQHASERMI